MEEESDKRAGGRQARQRDYIDRPGDQREKPEKKGAVYGEILFVHLQRLATPLVISNVLVCPPLIRSFAMTIKVFCRKLMI
ncbi:hypothetical protein AB9D95_19310 [Klebsiella africana]|uniref:hypothetical protein n=1 Tax=Klebsiella africana TaxID=2489010 RepID=UPI001CFD23A7|nr:hypothetical protein [Klebsiella africana]UDD42944.1 hypothetical protein LGL98_01575 [Klebsiella africana]